MTAPDLPIEEVFKRVRQDLGRQTKGQQSPWELSSLEGSFSFKQHRGAVSTAKAPDDLDEERRILAEERSGCSGKKNSWNRRRFGGRAEETGGTAEKMEQSRWRYRKNRRDTAAFFFLMTFLRRKLLAGVCGRPFLQHRVRDNRYVMETKNERKSIEMIPLPRK